MDIHACYLGGQFALEWSLIQTLRFLSQGVLISSKKNAFVLALLFDLVGAEQGPLAMNDHHHQTTIDHPEVKHMVSRAMPEIL